MLSIKYSATGPETESRLQFDRYSFSDESRVVVGEERTDHVEHGVTEATDVHNASSLTNLNPRCTKTSLRDFCRKFWIVCKLPARSDAQRQTEFTNGSTIARIATDALRWQRTIDRTLF